MSHIVQIKSEVKCVESLRAACKRQDLASPEYGEHKLFSDQRAKGWAVRLTDWIFPVVFDTESGQAAFDNYGGEWGEQSRLDSFLQAYAVEKTKLEARRKGHTVTEQAQTDGSIKLSVSVG